MATDKLLTLGDRLQMYVASPIEARFIYQEVFESRCYDVPDLPERPFIVDVGANIGLFVLFAADRWPAAEILAFEPIPDTAELLRRNLAWHAVPGVAVHQVALGRAVEREVPFTYYPMIPGNSTRYPHLKEASKRALAGYTTARVADRMYRGREVRVDVERLAAFLPADRPVDLLKVDAEGAELEVLQGIDRRQWPLVRRVVLEVPEADGQLDAVCALLREQGLVPEVRADGDGTLTRLVHARADLAA